MSLIDYSVQGFSLIVGGLDISPMLTSLALSLPISEPEQPLVWSGEFELEWTLDAESAGVTEADLSEFGSPARWSKGVATVQLSILGAPFPKMRIGAYQYLNGVGRGSLTQVLALGDRRITSTELAGVYRIGQPNPLGAVAKQLLDLAIPGMGSLSSIGDESLRGEISIPYVSEEPVKEAQQMAGINWRWLTVDTDEKIDLLTRPTDPTTPLFSRSIKEVELEVNPDNVNFAANMLTVTGSHQITPLYGFGVTGRSLNLIDDEVEDDTLEGRDEQGRARTFTTASEAIFEEAFPDQDVNQYFAVQVSTGQVFTREVKVVYYLYFDLQDRPITEAVGNAVLTEIASLREAYRRKLSARPPNDDQPVATLSIKKLTKIEIFPDQQWSRAEFLELAIADITLEGYDRKVTFKPRGVVTPERFPGSLQITLSTREQLNTGATLSNKKGDRTPRTDPRTGQEQRLERETEREPRNLAPEYDLETEQFSATVELRELIPGLFESTETLDIGFCPSQLILDRFANRLAKREWQRRNSRLITLPIPSAWAASGFRPFAYCHIHDAAYLMEAPIISISDGEMVLRFQGDRVGTLPNAVPIVPSPVPIYPQGLAIAPVAGLLITPGVAIAPLQFQAVGGAVPYTFSASGLPVGLSLSSSGLLTGTAAAGTYTITVTDALDATASYQLQIVALPTSVAVPDFREVINLTERLGISTSVSVGSAIAIYSTLGIESRVITAPAVRFDVELGITSEVVIGEVAGTSKDIAGFDEFLDFLIFVGDDNSWPTGTIVRWSTTGTLPTSTPQVVEGVDYELELFFGSDYRMYTLGGSTLIDFIDEGTGTHTLTEQ